MKFRDGKAPRYYQQKDRDTNADLGMWLVAEGKRVEYAEEVFSIDQSQDGKKLSLLCPTSKQLSRGDSLNRPTLTIVSRFALAISSKTKIARTSKQYQMEYYQLRLPTGKVQFAKVLTSISFRMVHPQSTRRSTKQNSGQRSHPAALPRQSHQTHTRSTFAFIAQTTSINSHLCSTAALLSLIRLPQAVLCKQPT